MAEQMGKDFEALNDSLFSHVLSYLDEHNH